MAAAAKRAAPVVAEGINFGDLGMYVAGGGLPEGDYCLFFTAQMYQAVNAAGVSRGPMRLGIMVDAYPLSDPRAESVKHQFYGLGSQADKSFAPNPDDGKSLVPIPGAPATTLNNQTNWALFLKSMYDCGLPSGIFTNNLTTIDGVHVHVTPVPEPEERKGFASQTGEAAGEMSNRPGTIAIVTEIKDDGKPWENTGGIPEVPKGNKVTAAKAAPKVNGAPVKAAAVADDDVRSAADNGVAVVLGKNPNGCPRLVLKTGTFTAVKSAHNEDMASNVINTFFGNDDALNSLLGGMGYVVAGGQVKVA